ncbi:MAG: hypothetical protein ABIO45_00660 [Burkholderiaceae bacterium]
MNVFFTLVVMELFVGGGGRLTELGPATLRMVLFALCLLASAYLALVRVRADYGLPLALGLVSAYLLVHLPAVAIGISQGSLPGDVTTEMQQSLYWLAAPFFAIALASPERVVRAALLVRIAGAVLAVAYLAAILGLLTGSLDYVEWYARLNETGEFSFRGESFFFYKGFLYLGISTIFFLALRSRHSTLWLLVVIAALVMTLTRGFILSTSIAALAMLFALRRWRAVGLAALIVSAAVFMMWIYLPSADEAVAVQREISNSQRGDDFAYMVEHASVGPLVFGAGFGSFINERINIENTFLWALWKIGVAGLVFWFLPLLLSARYFLRVPRATEHFPLACAYFFATVLIYVQTATNPYLNNPIGLSFALIALFSLRTLSRLPQPVRVTAQPRADAVPVPAAL